MEAKTTDLIAKRARAFRRALTEPEVMLWSRLKKRGTDKPVFRRQVACGSIILATDAVILRAEERIRGR